jgi:NAD(P)-dependent dehydrogenase (short-subunit alcohol dehydrogenase family)
MRLQNKNVVVIGGSRGLGRVIVAAAHAEGAQVLSVARRPNPLGQLAAELPAVMTLATDATEESTPASVFQVLQPDVLVLCGGALPYMAPLQDQTWEGFARNWNSDVRASFLFCQAAIRLPLAPGSTIVLISSGAALGGSTISGGYAGAKRMQMFMAQYCQDESDRLKLGLRFVALAPMRIMPDTDLGKLAVSGYTQYLGISAADFIKGMDSPQTPQDVAEALVAIVTQPRAEEGSVFTVSGKGVEPVR